MCQAKKHSAFSVRFSIEIKIQIKALPFWGSWDLAYEVKIVLSRNVMAVRALKLCPNVPLTH